MNISEGMWINRAGEEVSVCRIKNATTHFRWHYTTQSGRLVTVDDAGREWPALAQTNLDLVAPVVYEMTISAQAAESAREDYPLYDGLMAYFPDALREVSRCSKVGNEQHQPGEPMQWARDKSRDHKNKLMRHLLEAEEVDDDGVLHAVKVAWRALALAQEIMERDFGCAKSPASTGTRQFDEERSDET